MWLKVNALMTMMRRQCCISTITILITVLISASITSCARNGRGWNPEDYTAKSGDTLYSIAWRYELDPAEFAAWNGITISERIRAGHRLHTRQPPDFETTAYRARAEQDLEEQSKQYIYTPPVEGEPLESGSSKNSQTGESAYTQKKPSAQKWLKAEKGDSLYAISKRTGVGVQQLAQLNQLKKPYTIQPGQTIFLKPLNNTVANSGKKTTATKQPAVAATKQRPSQEQASWPTSVRWQWPSKGKVVKKFDRRRNDAKGIDIAGKAGDTVVASADGKVVYSGSGLISYGNLIIIKHNKTFLSAYAYNRKLLVKEGDSVKAGSKIAEMGNKEKQTPQLHFEVLKNGKPVDPLKYLPWK